MASPVVMLTRATPTEGLAPLASVTAQMTSKSSEPPVEEMARERALTRLAARERVAALEKPPLDRLDVVVIRVFDVVRVLGAAWDKLVDLVREE